jgi:hypothetical protein
MFLNKTLILLTIFFSFEIFSQCNFPTGNYIDDIDDPSQIIHIDIQVPKSAKYAKNLFKTFSSKSSNIAPSLKKKFDATIKVNYSFGECSYRATIRQSGDWKDHIGLKNGQPIRSLDIKLINGNIINAVSFKLLIPDTRNGMNEILGSLILRDLGFITPETFEVSTSVNGVNSLMLFQEKTAKELLERNLRREGPIFEGDESMLWSYKDYEIFELEPLSLSRLVNNNWFEKGTNSQALVLNSFAILQNAYLKFGYQLHNSGSKYSLFPNIIPDEKNINYHTALLAMNGLHGLRPHNRKFYYNALDESFEHIYYDGDTQLNIPLNTKEIEKYNFLEDILPLKPNIEFIKISQSLNSNGKLKENFLNRVIDSNKAINFFESAIKQFKANINSIDKTLNSKQSFVNYGKYFESEHYWYKSSIDVKGVDQLIVTDISPKDDHYIIQYGKDNASMENAKSISKILSRNNFKEKRAVFMPLIENKLNDPEYKNIIFENGLIKMSKGIKIKIVKDQKTINFTQSNPLDWVLISGSELDSWKIIFKGLEYLPDNTQPLKQRFNNYGLTGCLTIFNSTISNSTFSLNNGGCEDSINIINSSGKNIQLFVKNAQADAVDADFSDLVFSYLNIENAANDCFDVSGGKYKINNGILKNCQDKGISVGEKSTLTVNKIIINNANIAVAAKDSSKVLVLQMEANQVNICADVKRKKQEFGGAELLINDYKCSATIDVDVESVFVKGKL